MKAGRHGARTSLRRIQQMFRLVARWAPLAVWALPALAIAQATPDLEYTQATDAGLKAFAEQRYSDARVQFARAHELRPSARTLRALGLTDVQLDDYTRARSELERALAHTENPLDPEQRNQVAGLLEWMRTSLGVIRLEVQPSDAAASIDGRGVSPGELVLAPGEHRLRLTAAGFAPYDSTFWLDPSPTPRPLRIALQKTLAAPQQARPTAVRSDAWLWVGGGGLVALAGGGVLFAVGQSELAAVEDREAGHFESAQDGEAQRDRGRVLTGVGIGLGALGLAGVATALVLRLNQKGPDREAAAISYEVGPSRLLIRGRF
jgi:tetratricopeptide (TPR) repeat protein